MTSNIFIVSLLYNLYIGLVRDIFMVAVIFFNWYTRSDWVFPNNAALASLSAVALFTNMIDVFHLMNVITHPLHNQS